MKKINTLIMVGLLTSSIGFAGRPGTNPASSSLGVEFRFEEGHGSSGYNGGPRYGNGPGYGGGHYPHHRNDAIRAQRAFDIMSFAQHTTAQYHFRRSIRQIRDAQFELQGVRNGLAQNANRRLNVAVDRLNYALYRGDRRAYQFESNYAIRILEDAKIDLLRSGLVWRR